MASFSFHPAVASWFDRTFSEPTACQREAWPAIQNGRHTLIAAPTGSGKTLAAFLCAIDSLLREGLAAGGVLDDVTRVLYVSPLKALSNDVQKNLQEPLVGIRQRLALLDLPDVEIRAWVRTGDTSSAERSRMRRQPPHIIVTTPESLYILLTSESGRAMLADVNTVIVDEIHALVTNKRGAHLSLSLERLAALNNRSINRIGLSATQKPMREIARFLMGGNPDPCKIVDTGHVRERDLALEITAAPLQPVMATEVWQEVYERLAQLIANHRTTLIFVNTRRLAERAARHLAERIGADAVTAHHGSLAREHRLDAEQRLKTGRLRALVATASLELGIDIGDVDLVCQIGSPRAISTLLQRVGRSGHALDALPKGRLFPTSRDDLVECAALLDAARRGDLETLTIPAKPLDVLAQQIVAEVASCEWHEDALYSLVTGAWPYRGLDRGEFEQVIDMLATGFSTRRGRRGAYLHRDAVNHRLRGRRGARLTALMNGGAIPDQFDYDVVLEPEEQRIGTLNEDFAFESLPGDIFQLGNTSYRIIKVEQGKVRVEDARGQPPNIPFWFGEAPGRSDELSAAVSGLRARIEGQLEAGLDAAAAWAEQDLAMDAGAARQLADYLGTARAALGVLPTQQRVVFERFFDEAGDMHLVIHSPFGSRINRAWGLALRKRFCRQFNFELQAAALEDSIVLSLGATHSFALDEVAGYLKPDTVREILTQALLAAPMFPTHWRWNANIALAVRRNRSGGRVPAQFQRMDAEDLVAVVFPDQLACQDNLPGYRRIPDHPLVNQTVADCLHDVMDIVGLERLLGGIRSGDVEVVARDLAGPSPLAQEILSARPYAFLDDAPAEERRTSAVQARPFLDIETAEALGRLDLNAIDEVRREAWPDARTADELHDALVLLGFLTEAEGQRGMLHESGGALAFGWTHLFEELVADRRATRVRPADGQVWWVAAERLAEVCVAFPEAAAEPAIMAVPARADDGAGLDGDQALHELLRGRMEGLGPVSLADLAATFALPSARIETGLRALQVEGFVIEGRFSGGGHEWCERRLLARIHRRTMKRLRREIEPVSRAVFMRYLLAWQRVT
ncbi:MAG: DEAD/DEAH box helicase, partial [Gammaproteobacteria bacterium]|nr:DEAD/DEAH box helicase [Gammaproteobacteria bacterium]